MPEPLTLRELNQKTDRQRPIGGIVRPTAGWLRPIRQALGLTLTDLARRLKVTAPAIRSFEQAEAEDRITLASLRRTADAMGCELVYVVVPRAATLATLADSEARTQTGDPATAAAPAPASPAEDPDKKVTDLTWRTQHGEM